MKNYTPSAMRATVYVLNLLHCPDNSLQTAVIEKRRCPKIQFSLID